MTEQGYFRGMATLLRNPLVEVQVAPDQGDPKRLVELAVDARRDADRRAKRERDDNLRWDEIWCVVDVDDHPRLPDARQQAAANGIRMAVSNPCFELWLLLHFADQTAPVTNPKLRALLRSHIAEYDKKVDCSLLHGGLRDAVRRARYLETRAATAGDPCGNPTTGVWRLVESMARDAPGW